MNILPLTIDELIAIVIVAASLLFQAIPIMNTLAGLAIIYLFMCVFLRKYEAIQRKLHSTKTK